MYIRYGLFLITHGIGFIYQYLNNQINTIQKGATLPFETRTRHLSTFKQTEFQAFNHLQCSLITYQDCTYETNISCIGCGHGLPLRFPEADGRSRPQR